ncbi:hypothetical protein HNQ56_002560 [Anaerotaenia torta]
MKYSAGLFFIKVIKLIHTPHLKHSHIMIESRLK